MKEISHESSCLFTLTLSPYRRGGVLSPAERSDSASLRFVQISESTITHRPPLIGIVCCFKKSVTELGENRATSQQERVFSLGRSSGDSRVHVHHGRLQFGQVRGSRGCAVDPPVDRTP